MSDPPRWWDSALDVEQFALQAADSACSAARRLAAARDRDLRLEVNRERIPAAYAALEHLRIDGRPTSPWAPLSGFVAARDGWVRLHGNYPHHAAAIERALGVRTREQLLAAAADRTAQEVEDAVRATGGIAVAVRTPQQWSEHPHARATADDPWFRIDAGDVRGPGTDPPRAVGSDLPMDGMRVLDLTRVIAGPTCSQLLACLGADVLRLDPPHRPEILEQHLSTGMGKRSAVADLAEIARTLHEELLPGADVVLLGYRPGSLDRFGLHPDRLQRTHPHLVIGALSAWGDHGPWGERGGFDSIVQAATGIAIRCASPSGEPGALPVQALDHATGFRLAGAVMDLLADGRAAVVRADLLGAARDLLARPAPDRRGRPALPVPDLVEVPSAHGSLSLVPPPLDRDGDAVTAPVGAYGGSPPVW